MLAVYPGAMAVRAWRLPPSAHPAAFGVCVRVATALLIAVCALEGKPPHWNWTR